VAREGFRKLDFPCGQTGASVPKKRDIDPLYCPFHSHRRAAARVLAGHPRRYPYLDLDVVFQSKVFFTVLRSEPRSKQAKGGVMKAVILAAGQGTRIRSVHGEHPKCLIEVDNTT